MTWVDQIEKAFKTLGGEASYDSLYDELGRIRGTKLTTTQKATVRKEIERKSSDSENYDKTEDLFYSVGGIGSGLRGLSGGGGGNNSSFTNQLLNSTATSTTDYFNGTQDTSILNVPPPNLNYDLNTGKPTCNPATDIGCVWTP